VISKYQNIFRSYLDASLNYSNPKNLYDPYAYILKLGGKRIRPILLLMTYDSLGNDIRSALPAALSIELFHNFSLVHDDIMDEATLRRGKATVHKKWDINTAILSGDVMLISSYQCLEPYNPSLFKKLTNLLSHTSRIVCEGQQFDMDFPFQDSVTKSEYLKMITSKTAVLLGCSMKMGALIGGLSENESDIFYNYGIHLGIAFQLQDDYLDVFGNADQFGKKLGGDIIENKKTLLYIFALNNSSADQKKKLLKYFSLEFSNSNEKIKLVKDIFLTSGAVKEIKNEIDFYKEKALKSIEAFPVSNKSKELFNNLTLALMKRKL
tara:strand:- start:1727 stop:2695 length:969 start_codon:yes stop_codon:yes gene_type:complete